MDIIDVGQLLSVRVHLVIIGIALPQLHVVLAGNHDPGIQHGEVFFHQARELLRGQAIDGVGDFPGGHIDLVEYVSPDALFRNVVIADGRGKGLKEFVIRFQRTMAFFREVLMEGFQIIGRLDEIRIAIEARRGKINAQRTVGAGELQLEGHLVDDSEFKGNAVHRHPGGDSGGQFLVENEMLHGEGHVVHGHFHAVGPLQPLAQGEGVGGAVVADLIIRHQVGLYHVGVHALHGQQVFRHAHEHVGVPVHLGKNRPQGAAVNAAFVFQLLGGIVVVGQARVFRQSFFHRGQLAGLNPFRQHGGLGVFDFRQGRDAHRGKGQHQRQKQCNLLHVPSSSFLQIELR